KEKILGNLNTAAELFADVLRKDPHNAAAMYELSRVYSAQKKHADALYFSKGAYKEEPGNDWYALNHAEVLQRNNRFKESTEIFEQLVERHPDQEEYYQRLAEAYVYAGEYEKGISVYDRMEKRIGFDPDVAEIKARIYQQLGKTDKAIAELQRLIENDPSDAEAYGMLAGLYQSSGQNEKALETFRRLEKVDPDNPFLHLSLADFYRDAGEKEKSVAELKLAIRNPRLDIETKISILGSYYTLVETYPELKDQAHDMCKLLVQTHPTDPRSHAVYGDFLTLDKSYDSARVEYRKAKELGSKEYSVYSQLLLIDSQLQDWSAMMSDSEEGISLFPDQPYMYFFNGLAKHHDKRYKEAATILTTGVNMVVDNVPLESQFYSSLGEVYHELGDHVRSDQSFEKAIALDPKDPTAMNNYAYFLSLRGEKLAKAEELSRQSLVLDPDQPSYEDTYGWIMFINGKYQDARLWIGKAMEHGG
ncbi:MAG: tetratricopeptide repeat protein, partial [Flavobacteriales bacterium]